MNKSASDVINVLCIEKYAGVANVVKDSLSDIKRATGLEKFVPNSVGKNAIKGAGAGAVAGAAGAMATNTGEKKDNFGAAIKGATLGAAGGAALGAAGTHILNTKGAKAFDAANDSFKRGLTMGAVGGGAAGAIGKDVVENGVEAVKKHIPSDIGDRATSLYDKVKTKTGDAFDKATDNLSSARGKVDGFVDSVGKKVDEVNKKLTGHIGNPPKKKP